LQADPFVSVIVPTRGRPGQLAACVAALDALDYPRDRFEVIVVEDVEGEGPAAARNRGAERARGELLAFTDDDCRPASGGLRGLVAAWAGRPEIAVGGRTTNGLADNAFAAASQTIVDFVYAHYNGNGVGARFFASNNLAVPAAAYGALGGFDERFMASEDRDFCARWLASGRRLASAPGAVVEHAPQLTLGRFCRRNFQYGRGAYRYHRERAPSIPASVRGELSFHRRLPALVRAEAAGLGVRRAASLAALLAAWQAANALGFAWEAASASMSLD
jgi:GT2 family glycosyltransferase